MADRFLVTADRCAIDLASGASVVMKIGVGGGAAEQARWAARCDRFHRVRHPAIAALVDYGGVGESHRFEAWRCGDPSGDVSDRSAQTLKSATRFLAACGLTTGSLTDADVHCDGGSTVVLPTAETGYVIEAGGDPGASRVDVWPLDECGICAIDRRVDAAIADLFSAFSGARPHIISIAGPPGSGCTTVACRAARVARTRGFVPIGGAMLERVDQPAVQGATALRDPRSPQRIAMAGTAQLGDGIAATACRSTDPIETVRGGPEWEGIGHEVILDRIPAEALVAAVRPTGLDGLVAARIRRAAEASRGLPARFAALLWQRRAAAESSRRFIVAKPAVLRVAEQSAVYGTDSGTPPPIRSDSESSEPADGWPVSGELAVLHRRTEQTAVLLRKGRHAPAVRQLRQIFGALIRRHEWVPAGEVGLTLASALLRRGDAQGALGTVEQARTAIERTGSDTGVDRRSRDQWTRLDRYDAA